MINSEVWVDRCSYDGHNKLWDQNLKSLLGPDSFLVRAMYVKAHAID
jgi:hypothetical protein